MENCAQVIRAYLAVLAVCLVLGVSGYFFRDQLYKNSSSRKIDSWRLFSREYDFPKTFSLPGRPIFIQLPPAVLVLRAHQAADLRRPQDGPFGDAGRGQEHFKFPAKLRFESSVGAAVVGGVNSGTDQAPPSLLSFFSFSG